MPGPKVCCQKFHQTCLAPVAITFSSACYFGFPFDIGPAVGEECGNTYVAPNASRSLFFIFLLLLLLLPTLLSI